MSLHVVLIVLHASLATIAFGIGCSLLVAFPRSAASPRLIAFYASMFVAVAALLAVVVVDWAGLPVVQRVVFGGLCLLGLYLLFRTERARSTLAHQHARWREGFTGHIGFVLISLFDAFCIVFAVDLQLSPFVVVPVAVLAVVVGSLAIRRVTRRVARY
jgi:hypothetical protein